MHGLGEIVLQVSRERLKAPKLGVLRKFIWFLELYISGSTKPTKALFYSLKLL